MYRRIIAAVLVLAAAFVCAAMAVPDAGGEKDLSKDLIRFHVIANSDSLQDQQLKREVRDAILDRVGDRFRDADTVEDARRIVLSSLNDIKAAAEQEISQKGQDYPVKVQHGHFDFPAKTYSSFSLPPGNYEAVRVVIGEGKGANWWCVLFPPLCFVDISNSVTVEPEAKEVSKEIREDGEAFKEREEPIEYEPQAEPVIQIRFKLFEVFNRSKGFMARWQEHKNDDLFARN